MGSGDAVSMGAVIVAAALVDEAAVACGLGGMDGRTMKIEDEFR